MPVKDAILRHALTLVDRARALHDLSPSRALWNDRASYLELLGDTAGAREARAEAAKVQPANARDHYLLANAYIRKEGPANPRAIAELTEAIRLNPKHYWSYFQRGMCFNKLGDYTQAAADFGT